MKIRRLTNNGISLFIEFLDSLTTDSPKPIPKEILSNNDTSEVVSDIEVQLLDLLPVNSKFVTAKYFSDLIGSLKIRSPESDSGMWAWLSLHYFDQICPRPKGAYAPGEIVRWVLEPNNFQKYYRHLLCGPWRIYSNYKNTPEIIRAVLVNPVCKPGELYEQLASKQEIISNSAVMELSTMIYFDEKKEGFKRGAGGKGPGSPRRLTDVFQQFSRTWDLYAMSPQQILLLLPSEFDKFRP